jgi:hypothetical protein
MLTAAVAILTVVPTLFFQEPEVGPAPEMKKLDVFLGDWAGKFKFLMPGMPEGEVDSTVKEEKYLGGMYHKTIYTVAIPGFGSLEGHAILGYDPVDKKFKSWTFDNMANVPREETGNFEGGKLVMISKPHGGTVTRATYEPRGKDEMFFTIEVQTGEEWSKVGECLYKKKAVAALAK